MSENIQPFTIIPNEVFNLNLSALQFRFLCNFIKISKKFNGHSFYGYGELAKVNQCGRAAAIKTVKELESMGFIEVSSRKNSSQSNDIFLNLERGFSRVRSGGFESSREGYLKDTPSQSEGYLKDTPGYLKDTPGYLKDTPHIDLKIINKNIINKNTGEGYLKDTPIQKNEVQKKTATGDVAPVRSIAKGEFAKGVCDLAQYELTDFLLIDSFKERFANCLNDVQLIKIGTAWAVRPYMNFQEKFDEMAGDFGTFFAEKSVKFALFKAKTHKNGEIIINF